MLCRSSFLAVGLVFLLAAAVLAGEPIYDTKPGHAWDQARDIFYVRRFPTGEIYEHPHAFAPPWNEFIRSRAMPPFMSRCSRAWKPWKDFRRRRWRSSLRRAV